MYINNPSILYDFIYIFHQQFVYIFQVTPEELRSLIGKYADTSLLAQNGVTIGGKKYMYLSSTDKVIRAKKGTSGVHAIKTTQSNYIFLFPLTQKTAVCLLPLERQVHYYSHLKTLVGSIQCTHLMHFQNVW